MVNYIQRLPRVQGTQTVMLISEIPENIISNIVTTREKHPSYKTMEAPVFYELLRMGWSIQDICHYSFLFSNNSGGGEDT